MTATEPTKASPDEPAAADPSMEDILASIRRILSEDEANGDTQPSKGSVAAGPHGPQVELPASETLILSPAMMVPDSNSATATAVTPPPAALPTYPPVPTMNTQNPEHPSATPPSAGALVAPDVAAAAASSVDSMVRGITADRGVQVHSNGPTLDEIVREELRPLLKQWLDTHLPGMVERLVRVELERVISRAGP